MVLVVNSIHPSPESLALPQQNGDRLNWGQVIGAGLALSIAQSAEQADGPILLITPSSQMANVLFREVKNFLAKDISCFQFPDWEILPYDHFSPHQDIISDRLKTLHQLPRFKRGVVIVPITTLTHRCIPTGFVQANSFVLNVGESFEIEQQRKKWVEYGYRKVSQVMGHGEFAVRGSVVDIFPMGQDQPIRIDLFDNEIESIKKFDIETQRSHEDCNSLICLPAREYPFQDENIAYFRSQWRQKFAGDPTQCSIYEDISKGQSIGGIEYYLPLFFEKMETLFDYLPNTTSVIRLENTIDGFHHFWTDVEHRYEQYQHDVQRPLLPPQQLFLQENELFGLIKQYKQIVIQKAPHATPKGQNINLAYSALPNIALDNTHAPLTALQDFVKSAQHPILFCAESPGRKEALLKLLIKIDIHPKQYSSWQDFISDPDKSAYGIVILSIDKSVISEKQNFILIAEADLYGQQVMQRRLRKDTPQSVDFAVKNLAELNIGHPVVHLEHGVGRYLGLVSLDVGDNLTEYLALEYANNDKLYVPVSALDLISQYSGTQAEHAPLHKLGNDQWAKAKTKAQKKAIDVAAELLEIHACRQSKQGFAFPTLDDDYMAFANSFGFETTPDQQKAIDNVLEDMQSQNPMDRLICGDVGFGKTEVALRAAFLAVNNQKQVCFLVPTTLLAQQHYETFSDRFANWPIKVEVLSRFRSKKEQTQILKELESGHVDIVIGTHKLIQDNIIFKNLGLLVIDEEHRFGVRQKEKIKKLRAEIDILTLTATPIPRTLNMALSTIRDLSIIATPPAKRLSVKTFIQEKNDTLIQEAITRELMRGGQTYYLHNDVSTIENTASHLQELCPDAKIIVAHGQMPERKLEQVMADFYHQRYHVLVCSTIIETGIDIPSANTIIIEQADKFGLAQLHQLRGRVGRSHHQAYAYCLTRTKNSLTSDAKKRLSAFESLNKLGSGFNLATHDLEIRGAGELLGDEQSGNINEVGYSLYMELLDRAVHSYKQGKTLSADKPILNAIDIDLNMPVLIPASYIPDVHSRLVLYKRIASCKNISALEDIQVEMIDRFGLLPYETQSLFKVASLKVKAKPLNVLKIKANKLSGQIDFEAEPNINPDTIIKLMRNQPQNFKLVGSQSFKFMFDMTDMAERFKIVDNLLGELAK
tara:strand:+ start:255062 stop:258535 length:3474 start_codon:yes stop_codon:yes gene_type:complete